MARHPRLSRHLWRVLFLLVFSVLFLSLGPTDSEAVGAPEGRAPENRREQAAALPPEQTAGTDTGQSTTLTVSVNVVLVRVVVRDRSGKAIGNLTKRDFQLLDNGKPQVISSLSIEQNTFQKKLQGAASDTDVVGKPAATAQPSGERERYIAYVFDDIHLKANELFQVRAAADRQLGSLQARDRAGLFSASGQTTVEFTDDRSRLHAALLHLNPHPIESSESKECPDVSAYMADLIVNKNDDQALQVAASDALFCAYAGDVRHYHAAMQLARSAAQHLLQVNGMEASVMVSVLNDVVRRLSTMPGQRAVVIVSPGFFVAEEQPAWSQIIDRVIRSNVVVNALDARGLYALPMGQDVDRLRYERETALANAEVLAALAEGTGGTFFHNNNDLDVGFRSMTAVPEFAYVLGFSPGKLSFDGRFHRLTVKVRSSGKLTVQARRGYYAAKNAGSPEDVKRDIERALLSQEQPSDFPIHLDTARASSGHSGSTMSVFVHIDVSQLNFQTVGDRKVDDVTVAAAAFEHGKSVSATQETIRMRLEHKTFAKLLSSGLNLRTSFDLEPGSYTVRVVVRDSDGRMAAESGVLDIR